VGTLEAYADSVADFIQEYPIPLFVTIVSVLVGFIVFIECRRPAKKAEKLEPKLVEEKESNDADVTATEVSGEPVQPEADPKPKNE